MKQGVRDNETRFTWRVIKTAPRIRLRFPWRTWAERCEMHTSLAFFAAAFVSTGCDYWDRLFPDEPEYCEAYFNDCTGEMEEYCWSGDDGRALHGRVAPPEGDDCRDRPRGPCGCITLLDPVCSGDMVFVNACVAECEGIYDYEPCGDWNPHPGCACPENWDPVCDEDGNIYGNLCEARCAGVHPVTRCEGEARRPSPDCLCDASWNPVCDDEGYLYPNPCVAQCVGADPVGPCGEWTPGPGCGCPDVWDPVCDEDGNRYGNRCEALCAGAGPVVPCDW